MELIVKFNLVLFLIFAIAFGATGFVIHDLLELNAKQEILKNEPS